MNVKLILLIDIICFILIQTTNLVYNPICSQCLQISDKLQQIYLYENRNLTRFKLPGFSKSTIVIDLRHLQQIPLDSQRKQLVQFKFIIQQSNKSIYSNLITDLKIDTNVYQLSTTEELSLFIYFNISEQYSAYQYLFRQSVSLRLNYSNDRIPGEDSSYVFMVSSQDNINLPKNKPNLDSVKPYFLQNQRLSEYNLTSSDSTYIQSTSYWKTQQRFIVPYFPYFSDCQNEGSMIQIMQILQHQRNCTLIPIDQTQWINEFTFGSFAVADKCDAKRKCKHSGEVSKTQYPQWQTLPADSVLFYISQQKIYWTEYKIDMQIIQDDLVACTVNNSQGLNSSDQYPLRVTLTMGYYQVTSIQKRIIQCFIDYSLYVPSTTDFQYQLEIVSYPLSHTYIMLSFGFNWYVYMIVFIMIGFISNVEHFILWIYHYWVAIQIKPIRIKIYLKVTKQIVKGTLLALALLLVCLVFICILMNGKIFAYTFYDQSDSAAIYPRVMWDYILQKDTNNYDSTQNVNLRSGRMGLAFTIIGVYIILITCHYFIGKQKNKDQYQNYDILGRVFRPLQWNRAKFLFGTFLYIVLSHFFIYVAYSQLYSANIWTFIVSMKVIQMVMQQITKSVYDDILPGLPLKTMIQIVSYLNTLSADDFYDFLFSFLVDVAMTMIQKAYVSQLQNIVVDNIKQKSQQFNKFYLNLMNQSQEQLSQHADIEQNQQNTDNQRVFIYRQPQQVQFFQQQIKQIYCKQQDIYLIEQCGQSQQQKRLKKKYFFALTKQYQKQRQLLLKDNKQKHLIQQQQKIKKYHNNNQNNNNNNNNNKNNNQNKNNINQQQNQQLQQRQSMIFELLVDNMAMIYTFLLQPFIVFVLWLTYDQSDILNLYGITYNTVVLYNLSALVIGLFSVINIIFIFHILQSYMDLSFEQQITSLLERFFKRKIFWKADDEDLNMNIQDQLRGADHYCLSSQFFFILTIYLSGMFLVLVGLSIIFKTNYNAFDDIASIPIILFWLIILSCCCYLCHKIAKLLNIWDYQIFENQNIHQQNQNQNIKLFGITDQLNFQNSQFNTENILFVDDIQKQMLLYTHQTNQKKSTQKGTRLSIELPTIKKKRKLKLQNMNLKIQNFMQKNEIILAHQRLQTICKKLQPLFIKDSFKMQYSLKNKQYIKNNIEKILPLVDFLPQLQQYKNIHSVEDKQKQQQNSKKQQTKNMQPGIAQLILSWFRTTQKQRQKRIQNGLEYQNKKKKCSYCYSTWGLYYGFGGICLECSLRMMKEKKQLSKDNQKSQNDINNKYKYDDNNLTVIHEQERSQYSSANDNFSKMHKD